MNYSEKSEQDRVDERNWEVKGRWEQLLSAEIRTVVNVPERRMIC